MCKVIKPIPDLTPLQLENYIAKIDVTDYCDNWTGYLDKDGYGQFRVYDKMYRAPRIAYKLHYKIDPLDKIICHICGNKACVNPMHIYLGTDADNARDRDADGTTASQLGTLNPACKLTEIEVLKIRHLWNTGLYGQKELGRMFGVSGSHISNVIAYRVWAHI